jgi:transposase
MGIKKEIIVKESLSELRALQKGLSDQKKKRIQMLMLLKGDGSLTKIYMGKALCVSSHSVQTWRKCYEQHGIDKLLSDERGGNKVAQITPLLHKKIEKRLNSATEGFRSYKEAQDWINSFGLEMKYQAVNKYLKRKFSSKLKVARKSHIHKDPAAEAVFKKPIFETGRH